ncbi:MAG: class I SAM-dependent methyltransferase [Bacteroidetes bacterium]|nr:class I SAM-dependent methyltransferase [Bacteroidota bacterium]MBS1739061.1 class I SAM-dependent methyltransferase [Bacteroidota bacterium]
MSNQIVTEKLSVTLKVYDPTTTANYRQYDEDFIHTKAYLHLASKLKFLCQSFERPITILDVGCGTGRYFHVLTHVDRLIALDYSENMLLQAQHPFREAEIPMDKIVFHQGNFYDFDFGNQSFDFIYSIGVLGEHTVFDEHVCNKLFKLLRPGGKLYFTVVDLQSRKSFKRKIMEALYPFTPIGIKRILDKRWETCYLTWTQLDNIVSKQGFEVYQIERYISEDPKWKGVHLECIATKL